MARKKTGAKVRVTKNTAGDQQQPASSLTIEQLGKLAAKLSGTKLNVYRVAEQMFGKPVEESVFVDLENLLDLKKCEECDEWQTMSAEFMKNYPICNGCLDRIDGHKTDDEE